MSKSTLLQEGATARDQLREQIRQTVRDAQIAAEKAAAEAGKEHRVIVVPPVPGQTTSTGVQFIPPDIPPRAKDVAVSFFFMIAVIVIGLPIVRAISRRIERGTPVAGPIPVEVKNQLLQISQSVDAIAIEVERISEGQRFTTKMLADRVKDGTILTPGSPGQ